jgi:hypothetical protein
MSEMLAVGILLSGWLLSGAKLKTLRLRFESQLLRKTASSDGFEVDCGGRRWFIRVDVRTLKENLLWVRTFDTIEELRAALVEFATRYNETWLVARHGYRTPAQVRADQCRLDQNTTADLKLAA